MGGLLSRRGHGGGVPKSDDEIESREGKRGEERVPALDPLALPDMHRHRLGTGEDQLGGGAELDHAELLPAPEAITVSLDCSYQTIWVL